VSANLATLQRWSEIWLSGAVVGVDECVTPDYVRHDANMPEIRGADAEKQFITMIRTALADLNFTADTQVVGGDMIAVLLSMTGTHRGELLGVPATGKTLSFKSMEMFRFVDGRIAEQWAVTDYLGMLQQLGQVPVR
jgi:steroid delta-isomerase-like uncharacterized protein